MLFYKHLYNEGWSFNIINNINNTFNNIILMAAIVFYIGLFYFHF